ncbi:hypothetical protein L9F63_002428, partial [Diploptera punctata]
HFNIWYYIRVHRNNISLSQFFIFLLPYTLVKTKMLYELFHISSGGTMALASTQSLTTTRLTSPSL